jgi:AcrR family transcriptional regulator
MGIKERRAMEKERRKQQIIEAAKEMFLSKSFESVTVEDIAQKAELSVGTIYQYFNSKDELFAFMNLSGLQWLTDQLETVYYDPRLSTREKILKYKDAMYKTYKKDPLHMLALLRVFLEENVFTTINEKLLKEINGLAQRLMNMMSSTYEEGVRQGEFKNGLGIAHSDIMWATFAGLVMWEEAKRRIDPKKDFLKPTLDLAFNIFCQGITKSNET